MIQSRPAGELSQMDQSKKTMRHFYCRDVLWETFEQMANDFDCSIDYLINEAMRYYARSKNYQSTAMPAGVGGQPTGAMPTGMPPTNAMPPQYSGGGYPPPGGGGLSTGHATASGCWATTASTSYQSAATRWWRNAPRYGWPTGPRRNAFAAAARRRLQRPDQRHADAVLDLQRPSLSDFEGSVHHRARVQDL